MTEETELGNDIQASSFGMGVRGLFFVTRGWRLLSEALNL